MGEEVYRRENTKIDQIPRNKIQAPRKIQNSKMKSKDPSSSYFPLPCVGEELKGVKFPIYPPSS
jgi:hypothetical protein